MHAVGGRGAAWLVGGAVAGALAAVALYGGGTLNSDAMWALAWGRQIVHGVMPDFSIGPTPHPLPNLAGIVLSPLGSAAEWTLLGLAWLAGGALLALVGAVAGRLGDWPAAIAAPVLLLTLIPTMLSVAPGFVDVPYAALVLAAVALEVARPRRGALTLAVLAVAGLLRPEAWLLSGMYWLWLLPALPTTRARVAHAALVAVAPVIWAGADLIATGDPTFSFTHTADATPGSGRDHGPSAIVHLPRFAVDNAGTLICLGALAGFAALAHDDRGRLVFGWLVATTAASAAPILAGTPLNERYFLATFALLCVFAAAGALRWLRAPRAAYRYAGLAVCVLLAIQAVVNLGDVRDLRRIMTADNGRREAARAVLTAGRLPCGPLVVPAARVRELAAVWTELPLEQVLDAHRYQGRGTYLTGSPTAMSGVVTLHRRPGTAATPPPGTTLVREHNGWQVRDGCA